MKKTMFITSVIMVIVMAIALTTSSLAWFSASGRDYVTTNALKVTAKAESSTGIGISQTGATGTWYSDITLTTPGNNDQNLMPLVPFAKKASGFTADDLLTALVGGKELPYLTKADLAEDHAKWVADNTKGTYKAIYEEATATFTADYYTDSEQTTFNPDFITYYEALVAEGLISDQNLKTTAASGTAYDAYMIGAKIDSNGKFDYANYADENLYRDGFYTNTFYLKNLATGSGAASITVDTTISFWFTGVTESQGVFTYATEDTPYTAELRKPEKYALDPTLCVAVLVRSNGLLTDAAWVMNRDYQDYIDADDNDLYDDAWLKEQLETVIAALLANDSRSDEEEAELVAKQSVYNHRYNPEWEIVAYAESKGDSANDYSVANLKMGKTATYFEKGDASGESYGTLATTDLNKTNTLALKGDHTYRYLDETTSEYLTVEIPADQLEVKVVAWYDAVTLNNNNSSSTSANMFSTSTGSADLKFALKFSTHTNG